MSTNGPKITKDQFLAYNPLYVDYCNRKIDREGVEALLGPDKSLEFFQYKVLADIMVREKFIARKKAENVELKKQCDVADAAVEQAKQNFAGDVKQKLGSK